MSRLWRPWRTLRTYLDGQILAAAEAWDRAVSHG